MYQAEVDKLREEIYKQIGFHTRAITKGSDEKFRIAVIYDIVKDSVLDQLREYLINDVNVPHDSDKVLTAIDNAKKERFPVID